MDMSLNKNCRPSASYWTKLCMVLSKQLCNGSRSLSNVCCNMGMTQSKVDPCVFYLKRDNKLILLVGTHVDDCAISEKPSDILAFKK